MRDSVFSNYDNLYGCDLRVKSSFYDIISENSLCKQEDIPILKLIIEKLGNNNYISDSTNVSKYLKNTAFKGSELDKFLITNTLNASIKRMYKQNDLQTRENLMADNIVKIADSNSKIIAWSHNGHLKRIDNMMGEKNFSKNNSFISIGLLFYKGTVSTPMEGDPQNYIIPELPKNCFEYDLNNWLDGVYLIDLVTLRKSSKFRKYADNYILLSIGAETLSSSLNFEYNNWFNSFDYLVFVNQVSPTKPMRLN